MTLVTAGADFIALPLASALPELDTKCLLNISLTSYSMDFKFL
jgi:hypothetical protein